MSRIKKNILTTIIVLLFCVSAPVLILFAQGYRWAGSGQGLEQTGGLFVATTPANAKVQVLANQKIIATTRGHDYLGGLKPGFYEVEVSAPQFTTWSKNIAIGPARVTKFEHVVLLRDPPKITNLTPLKHVTELTVSPNGRLALARTDAAHLYLVDLKSSQITRLNDKKAAAWVLNEITWLNDRSIAFLQDHTLLEVKLELPLVQRQRAPRLMAFDYWQGLLYALDESSRSVVLITNDNHSTRLLGPLPAQVELQEAALNMLSPNRALVVGGGVLYEANFEDSSIKVLARSPGRLTVSPNQELLLWDTGQTFEFISSPALVEPITKILQNTPKGNQEPNGRTVYWDRDSQHIFWADGQTLRYSETAFEASPIIYEIPSKIQKTTLVAPGQLVGLWDGRISRLDLTKTN